MESDAESSKSSTCGRTELRRPGRDLRAGVLRRCWSSAMASSRSTRVRSPSSVSTCESRSLKSAWREEDRGRVRRERPKARGLRD